MLSGLALLVVIVIDQFRTDELLRFHQLNPAGLGRLVNQGVFYDDAHHIQYFNATCPGHTAISTGAPPALHGIMVNDDWDRTNHEPVYCVSDVSHQWIDTPADSKNRDLGTSPKRILTSTVGDELKSMWPDDSRVISISVKDRAAISLGGHRADGAFWHAPLARRWTSSDYYFPSKNLPAWFLQFVKSHPQQIGSDEFTYAVSLEAVDDTADAAIAALDGEKLGTHKHPDILWVSFSTHDFVGHSKGDVSEELKTVLKSEDDNIAKLLKSVSKKLGNKKFMVVLTGDHGAGYDSVGGAKLGMPGGKLNQAAERAALNACLKSKGVDAGGGPAVESFEELSVFLSDKIKNPPQARIAAKECLAKRTGIWNAFTRDEILEGRLPKVPWLNSLSLTYFPARGPDVIGVLQPYWNSSDNRLVGHETPYDYDSWVPLAFWWNGVHHKLIHRRVKVTSLAPTLARILETRRPSGATDEYLTEVLDNL